MPTVFYTVIPCMLHFVSSESHIVAGVSCEECPGTWGVWVRRRTWGEAAGRLPSSGLHLLRKVPAEEVTLALDLE